MPDQRGPVFTVPDWVAVPPFLAPHLAARNSATLADLPYEVTVALHFSNGGGVYTATDKRTGERVILKEARPHAGLAADGSDAVARLRRERDRLTRLSGLGIAPAVRGYFEAGGHHFLAEELIEGMPLNAAFAERYPLARPGADPAAAAAYAGWAVRICAAAESAARRMHERGVVFNDLHMFNIMVRPDDSVAFIDFAAAAELDAAAAGVGLTALLSRLGGYGTDVDPAALSAGERQLIALTRAYLSAAPFVILDEAACHLDPAAEETAECAFARGGGTLIVIAHRITSALRARRVLVLDGTRARAGDHVTLLAESAMYRDLVGYWAGSAAPRAG